MRRIGFVALGAFVATVLAANWAINTFGVVSVGFGLLAPAGVYFAGLAFTLRDIVQETLGKTWVIWAILVGAALSYFISPAFAIASGVAFLFSEMADLLVYTPLRERQFVSAVIASNLVGSVVDSVLFLWIAFGSLDFIQGQVVGKAWITLAALPVVYLLRSRKVVAA